MEGRRHAYSNLGYTVLGQVIERVTGQGYEEFMTTLLEAVEIKQMKIGRTRKNELSDEEVDLSYSFHFHKIIPDLPHIHPHSYKSSPGWDIDLLSYTRHCAPAVLPFRTAN